LKGKDSIICYIILLFIIIKASKSSKYDNRLYYFISWFRAFPDYDIDIESKLVMHLGGYITRETFADLIGEDYYLKGINWILKNPDRYEQLSTANLAKLISSLP